MNDVIQRLERRLAQVPLSRRTSKAQARLVVGLGLALAAAQQLADEADDHETADEAGHLAWTLGSMYGVLLCDSHDTYRLEWMTRRAEEVIDEWHDADQGGGVK